MTNRILHQIARFSATGAANTVIGLLAIYAMMIIGAHYLIANATGYGIGFVVSFYLNRHWTFQKTGTIGRDALSFTVLVLVAYGANIAVMITLVEVMSVSPYPGQVAGVGTYALISFVGMKYFVFRTESTRSNQ